MSEDKNTYDQMAEDLEKHNLPENVKKSIYDAILKMKKDKLNILLVGGTGAGKSSTINALFNMEVAKVGRGVDPETMEIAKYEFKNNLVLWDSPGVGDTPQKDERHKKQITNKLREANSDGTALIDLVLVVVDGSNRDMSSIYDLVIDVLIPNVEDPKSIILAINQCDQILKGKGWNYQTNTPLVELEKAIKDKEDSVRNRIKDGAKVIIEPMCYSAEYKYNISKLLFFILRNTPEKKRLIYAANLNKNKQTYKNNDSAEDYNKENKGKFEKAGEVIGEALFPHPFKQIGKTVGGKIGKWLGGLFD